MAKIILISLLAILPTFGQRRDPDNAPKMGGGAPQVAAVSLDGENNVDLSKPKKVTVLTF